MTTAVPLVATMSIEPLAPTVTDSCKYQQGSLRYAPTALLGLPLINAIDQEGHDIDDYQII